MSSGLDSMYIFHLRSMNVIFGLVNFILIYCVTTQLHGEKQVLNTIMNIVFIVSML